MKKLGRAFKAGVKGFADAFAPARYQAGGVQVRCTHCKGEMFREHEALLNTTGATLVSLDWLDKSGTALLCENCGLIQWYAKKPDRLQAEQGRCTERGRATGVSNSDITGRPRR